MPEKSIQYPVALIGCGVIGERRLAVIEQSGLGQVSSVFDPNRDRARAVGDRYGARIVADPFDFGDAKIVVVATPNQYLAGYAGEALQSGRHVLVEKPGAISLKEMQALASRARGTHCKVGYNLRFHPAALAIARELKSGELGKILWIRAAYGHGGRPGYEKEWRFDKRMSGGGEIIDQGVHLLDLLHCWTEERFYLCAPVRQNAFYRADVEDNGFLTLASESLIVAHLHCSATQWKNLFRMEIATQNALLVWEGLGGSYGPETLTIHRRNPAGGAPATTVRTFEEASEQSWGSEWRHFYENVSGTQELLYSRPEESLWIFEVLEEAHESTNLHR